MTRHLLEHLSGENAPHVELPECTFARPKFARSPNFPISNRNPKGGSGDFATTECYTNILQPLRRLHSRGWLKETPKEPSLTPSSTPCLTVGRNQHHIEAGSTPATHRRSDDNVAPPPDCTSGPSPADGPGGAPEGAPVGGPDNGSGGARAGGTYFPPMHYPYAYVPRAVDTQTDDKERKKTGDQAMPEVAWHNVGMQTLQKKPKIPIAMQTNFTFCRAMARNHVSWHIGQYGNGSLKYLTRNLSYQDMQKHNHVVNTLKTKAPWGASVQPYRYRF
eukprot:GEMP01017457.1.p1 GENE.GEMP01017457.1~~GEMP01017457.1.p1  ORF type:complete len:276 (+),score=40.59 GEMP01017457.1:107-934(+)